jgi:hypothetical protein
MQSARIHRRITMKALLAFAGVAAAIATSASAGFGSTFPRSAAGAQPQAGYSTPSINRYNAANTGSAFASDGFGSALSGPPQAGYSTSSINRYNAANTGSAFASDGIGLPGSSDSSPASAAPVGGSDWRSIGITAGATAALWAILGGTAVAVRRRVAV